MSSGFRIEKLARAHAVDGFDCGKEEPNPYLEHHAWQSQQSGACRTFVALEGDAVSAERLAELEAAFAEPKR